MRVVRRALSCPATNRLSSPATRPREKVAAAANLSPDECHSECRRRYGHHPACFEVRSTAAGWLDDLRQRSRAHGMHGICDENALADIAHCDVGDIRARSVHTLNGVLNDIGV